MSDKLETVIVVREDHPAGKVTINKSDMTKDDKLCVEKKEEVSEPIVEKKEEVSKPTKKSK